MSGALPLEPPLGLHHEPVAELTVPGDPHLHFKTIPWSLVMK